MKVDCRTCQNWFDNFTEDESAETSNAQNFYGCRIFGDIENFQEMSDCPHYTQCSEPFILCRCCKLPVPRVCYLLGECVNCTDTDLFCIENCQGGPWKTYCTHWVRLNSEGMQLIHEGKTYQVFPGNSEQKGKKRRSLKQTYLKFLEKSQRQE